ncbi:MAG: UDP-N-acetylmuramoyl-L-alanyl-D-glutamate--2,6-diaminopimelate ligase [Deltaproteobacteria bacterium]|nr:UDP-N-acetylmuramoyl-L-alanyl-D-glutamate--2,6-diaminopimelate ligase [Deltaproteobacteria bacterium]
MDSISPTSQRLGARLATIALELGGPRDGVTLRGDGETRVSDVQQDSRRVSPGDLFVARMGSGGDLRESRARMERYVEQAIAHGATAVLRAAGSGPPLPLPMIEVPEARLRAAIGVAASAVHHHPSYVVEVVAVTGTNGKTTCTTLVADALDRLAQRPACALVGTVAVRLGAQTRPSTHTTPEGDEVARVLAWARGQGASHAAIEASSHALDQRRLAGTRVRVAAFTNLTQDHLDYHLTLDAYGAAKRLLFEEMHPGDSVINVDDGFGEALARSIGGDVLRVSASGKPADIRVRTATIDARGIDAIIETPRGVAHLKSPLLGAHNLDNLALSLGTLVAMEIDPQRAADALGASRGARGRLELASNPAAGEPVVLVDYAHTPDALARVLGTLRPLTTGRLLCVFGCGGDRDPGKRAPMGRAVAEGADLAFVTSDNPRTEDPRAIVDAILAGMGDLPDASDLAHARRARHVEVDRALAIERAIAAAAPDDVILIAGKGHEDYQIIGTEKRPFDDVAVAQKALAAVSAETSRSVRKGG